MNNIGGKYVYDYPMAATTATGVFLIKDGQDIKTMISVRADHADAFPGVPSLIGGFTNIGKERTYETMSRETKEECNIDIDPLSWTLFHVSDRPGTDPRYDQVINVCYYTWITMEQYNNASPNDDIKQLLLVDWKNVLDMKLAFNHTVIINEAEKILKLS